MKRRDFLFTSLKAAVLLSPALSLRKAFAQQTPPRRVFFWINCGGYPDSSAFFPTGSDPSASPILGALAPLKDDMVVIEGIDIRRTGLNPRGADHLRSMGKVLTAKDINPSQSDPDNEGEAGGISIDQLLVRDLNLQSLELVVTDRNRDTMREQPFATGANQFKVPISAPEQAWDRLFGGFQPPMEDPAVRAARLKRLNLKKSLLDDVRGDLSRLRRELTGLEKVKLDIHEDAIRKTERAVQADLDATPPPSICSVVNRGPWDGSMPARAGAHLDLVYSAFACDRVQVAGLVWGMSGYHWRYDWAGVQVDGSIHDEVHHLPGERRDDYIRAQAWDWQQLGNFVQRLKMTPEGSGSMLDNTLVVAMSHFGVHHDVRSIPVVLFGNAKGRLQTGRNIRLPQTEFNDKVLTSVARLMGANISGIGDDPNCGPLAQL